MFFCPFVVFFDNLTEGNGAALHGAFITESFILAWRAAFQTANDLGGQSFSLYLQFCLRP